MAHGARSAKPPHRFRTDHDGGNRAQGKPRRAFPRRLSRQERELRQVQYPAAQRLRQSPASHPRAVAADAGRAEADHPGDEVMATATFRIWRGERGTGAFKDYAAEITPGMVVLDAVHQIQ